MRFFGAGLLALGILAAAASSFAERPPIKEWLPTPSPASTRFDPQAPSPLAVSSGETLWVNVRSSALSCPGSSTRGGEITGGNGPLEVWCFEGGAGDSTSTLGPRTFTFNSYDRRILRNDIDSLYWRATTFQALSGARSMWCGGYNDQCGSWIVTTGGYGNYWEQSMQLSLGPFNATNGCSLQFRTRYVLECNYDYGYLEVFDARAGQNKWRPIDGFNGRSGCTTGPTTFSCFGDWNNYRTTTKCGAITYGTVIMYPREHTTLPDSLRDWPGFPFGGTTGDDYVIIRGDSISSTPAAAMLNIRWRFSTDTALSTADGADVVKGFWVDDVTVRVAGATVHSATFDGLAENALPASPYSFPQLNPVYDGWAIRYDLDAPLEGFFLPSPGDSGLPSACQLNASWQWSIAASPGGIPGGLPTPDNNSLLSGYQVLMQSPSIPLNYNEGSGGFARPGCVFQFDAFQNMLAETCDFTDRWVRVHQITSGRWCDWINIDGFINFGGGTFWNINGFESVSQFTASGADSVQLSWISLDTGNVGDGCWDLGLPPHKETQYVIDNVSVGIIDGSATAFAAGGTNNPRGGIFQDTFNIRSCMHTPNVANADLGAGQFLLTDNQESLTYVVTDPDIVVEGNVLLHYAKLTGAPPYVFADAPGSPIVMNLSVPNPPGTGGDFTATICDTPWTPGTTILYYVEAIDNAGNHSYSPTSSSPTAFPRTFLEVDILPTAGASILFVDDIGGTRNDYSPCRTDTVAVPTEDFIEETLISMGFQENVAGGYDKYDVGFPSSNQRIAEAYGFRTSPPDSPQVGTNVYPVVIWDCGTGLNVTIQDTTQSFLKEYVFDGGKLVVFGDRIVEDLTTAGVSVDALFLPGILGAEPSLAGVDLASPFLNPDLQPEIAGVFPDANFPAGDSLHLYVECSQIRPEMDKVSLSTTAPAWAHPSPFLYYDDKVAPYDSLAAIYNFVTFTPDTGKVVFFTFGATAIVDHGNAACSGPGPAAVANYRGRGNLLRNVLLGFGLAPRTGVESPISMGSTYVTALNPAAPNPFNPVTKVSFSLAQRSAVSLTVYDVMGRMVRTLVNDTRDAGRYDVVWNGHNESGHEVASGVYFARMEAGAFKASEKLTLLK